MFLREKYDAFQLFKLYLDKVEKETSNILKFQISSRGEEFTLNEFNNFYNDRGIKRQTSTPRTPRQNGIVKRRNRSMMDCARTLMMDKNIALKY